MNSSYNHIKHFVDTNEVLKSNILQPGVWIHEPKHHANYLDYKQRHTGFDYYEYDMPKFGISSWAQTSIDRSSSCFNFWEHCVDPEHNQARYQAIHSHGRSDTRCSQWDPCKLVNWH